ncbi:MAG: hypothetical protein AABY22_03620 [Nanoarchaeota archaeon]
MNAIKKDKYHLCEFVDLLNEYPTSETIFEIPIDKYSHSQKIVDKNEAVKELTSFELHWAKMGKKCYFHVRNEYKNYPIITNGIRKNKTLVVIQMETELKNTTYYDIPKSI